ncbi:hypothetical protein DPMN_006681 [Dreissena polymorpha]|uniref:Uncharacterized protein n=1 Tax=Dreissena polymorpha TaxID=45954 RepID=A0A9D4RV69_DREPO|nr:hypothetical protein DPMN_006681 [Dreissena polymorpha]
MLDCLSASYRNLRYKVMVQRNIEQPPMEDKTFNKHVVTTRNFSTPKQHATFMCNIAKSRRVQLVIVALPLVTVINEL